MKSHSDRRFGKQLLYILPLILLLACTIFCWLRDTQDTSSPRITKNRGELAEPIRESSDLRVSKEFRAWLDSQVATDPQKINPGPPPDLQDGIRLATERRKRIERLIRENPQQAIAESLTWTEWQSLPEALRSLVERPFSIVANYAYYPVCLPPGSTPVPGAPNYIAELQLPDGQSLQTFVYGTRSDLGSKRSLPAQGIMLDGLAALRPEVIQTIPDSDMEAVRKSVDTTQADSGRSFANGEPVGTAAVHALVGGRLVVFSDEAEALAANQRLTAAESRPGTLAATSYLLPSGDAPIDWDALETFADVQASAWTETKKKVFMIRCDFSDKTDAAFSVVAAGTYATLLNTTVSDAIKDFSYGKTWIEASVSSSVIRLPQTAAYYAAQVSGSSRNDELLNDSKAAYQAANPEFVIGNYDIIGVYFVSIGMSSGGVNYGGLAGGPNIWIQGSTDAGLHVHEFGHNYGIGHASFWKPSVGSSNPVDPAGTNEEYGDPFDVMGNGELPDGVFHSQAKQRLNWLSTGEWTDATAAGSGVYRLYRIDHPATAGVRGIRVDESGGGYYWLSYRRLYENSWLKAGANLVWERSGQTRSWLVDTTPGSIPGSSDRTDGSIAIGRTYSDGNSHITPLARGGNPNNEWLDIRVNTGPFAGNVAPTVTLQGPSAIAARQTSVFTAQGVDANGDALSYSWDFGQGFAFDNHPSTAYAWNSGGTYTVKVTVTDMKGGTAQATKVVTVTDAITTWSTRANSSIGDFKALAASPTKVIAVGEDYSTFSGPVATSADGTTWTATQLGNNQQAFAAIWDGSQFLLAGQDYTFTPPDGWRGCVFTSPTADAGTWTRRIYSGPALSGIAYGNNVHVAVGENGTIHRSTNAGVSWTLVPSGTTNRLASVAFGGGKFVIVGHATTPNYNGETIVLVSTDGLTWTNTSSGAGVESWQDFRKISWAQDRFLASGWYSKLRHSTDLGTTFATTRTNDEEIAGFAYGNGVWFATGIDRVDATVEVDVDLVSSDGSNWTALTTPALENRNAAIFFNNTFITVSNNNSIRQSGVISQNANGYFTWRENNFPDHGPLTSPGGDHDADGMANLLEYSLGRSPSAASGADGPAALPRAAVVGSEPLLNGRISLEMNLPNPTAADLIHVVEAASSPAGIWSPLATKTGAGSWVWNAGGTSRIIEGTPVSGRVVVKVGDSLPMAGNPLRFLRLRVSVNQ